MHAFLIAILFAMQLKKILLHDDQRGCVSAGATAALNFLGLNDAVDVVYGSSAGAMVSAYFVSRQFSGLQIYHGELWSIHDIHSFQ